MRYPVTVAQMTVDVSLPLTTAVEMIQTPEGLLVGRYPITQAQWCAVMGGDPGHTPPTSPATNMTQEQAREFCRLLSETEVIEYRLPTVAEWHYAATMGSKLTGCFQGDRSKFADYAWYGNEIPTAPRVGEKLPNGWGLHDTSGCVWEMTHNPMALGAVWSIEVMGGSFREPEFECSWGRKYIANPSTHCDVGFRVVAGKRQSPRPFGPPAPTYAFGVKDYTDLGGW